MARKHTGRKWPASRVETWPIDKLRPNPRNTRQHSPEQVDQIIASINEWGWTNPILADEDGLILAGHGRLMAARKLGLTLIPTTVARGWTEAQKRAYVIADNKLAENAEWDTALLKVELGELKGEDFDIGLIGFSAKELEELVLPTDGLGDGDETERTTNAVIQFNIVFDDTDQQEAWFGFVRRLRADYPAEETLGARLSRFISEGEHGAR